MNGALDTALVNTLNSLVNESNRAKVLPHVLHPRDLDPLQGDLHLVDKVQVNDVVCSMLECLGAGDSKRNLAAHKGEVHTISNFYLVCNDRHCT